jgi:hypothetical protein
MRCFSAIESIFLILNIQADVLRLEMGGAAVRRRDVCGSGLMLMVEGVCIERVEIEPWHESLGGQRKRELGRWIGVVNVCMGRRRAMNEI